MYGSWEDFAAAKSDNRELPPQTEIEARPIRGNRKRRTDLRALTRC
jgi:hypothetical protein